MPLVRLQVIKKCQHYYPKLNYRNMRLQIEKMAEKRKETGDKWPMWKPKKEYQAMHDRCSGLECIDSALKESLTLAVKDTKPPRFDNEVDTQRPLLQLLDSATALGKAAWVLVVAAISPLNYDYDDSVKTLRFVQFLNQTIEVEMGANVKTERGRRLWQSRVNLQMLARIKKVRQARQGSDNMMKKLGTVLKIPVRPKNPARNARKHDVHDSISKIEKKIGHSGGGHVA